MRQSYPDDLTDKEWFLIKEYTENVNTSGRKPKYGKREMLNAIFYLLRSGCSWRNLPHDFPPWKTVYTQYRTWKQVNFFEKINSMLSKKIRNLIGRAPQASGGIIDSQSVKSIDIAGFRGYDGGKKIKGIKRHILVDTLGLLLDAEITTADINDREGLFKILNTDKDVFKNIKKIWADMGYQGKVFISKIHELFDKTIQIVKRPNKYFRLPAHIKDIASYMKENNIEPIHGFKVLPKRWVVERTFAWINKYRRLAKNYEVTFSSSKSMIFLAMIRNNLRKIMNL